MLTNLYAHPPLLWTLVVSIPYQVRKSQAVYRLPTYNDISYALNAPFTNIQATNRTLEVC